MFNFLKYPNDTNGIGMKRCPNCGKFPVIKTHEYPRGDHTAEANCACLTVESKYVYDLPQKAILDCVEEWNKLIDVLSTKGE